VNEEDLVNRIEKTLDTKLESVHGKLDDMKEWHKQHFEATQKNKTDIAVMDVSVSEHRDNFKWLRRVTVGGFVGGVIGLIFFLARNGMAK